MVGVSLYNLIGICPVDFLVIVKYGNKEVLKGITWVVPHAPDFYMYRECNVVSFKTDFYNTEIEITIKD